VDLDKPLPRNILSSFAWKCVTCCRRGLFGSFGRSGSLPDSNVIISYYRNLAAFVELVGLSALPKTRFTVEDSESTYLRI